LWDDQIRKDLLKERIGKEIEAKEAELSKLMDDFNKV